MYDYQTINSMPVLCLPTKAPSSQTKRAATKLQSLNSQHFLWNHPNKKKPSWESFFHFHVRISELIVQGYGPCIVQIFAVCLHIEVVFAVEVYVLLESHFTGNVPELHLSTLSSFLKDLFMKSLAWFV